MDDRAGFGAQLRRLREARGLSLRALARSVNYDPGALSRIENGRRTPSPELLRALDVRLCAEGALARRAAVVVEDPLTACAEASVRFARWAAGDRDDRLDIDAVREDLACVAARYPHVAPSSVVGDLRTVRDRLWRLAAERPRPGHVRELLVLGGLTLTVLAHAARDLGSPDAACRHAVAAERLAGRAEHAELRAWTAGTRALIAEISGDCARAVALADDGRDVPGACGVRLAAVRARSWARLGRAEDAVADLATVRLFVERGHDGEWIDGFGGVLAFSAVTARCFLANGYGLLGHVAVSEHHAAAAMSATTPPERGVEDEALLRADIAVARIVDGDISAAAAVLAPVLGLPVEQRIPPVLEALSRVSSLLDRQTSGCARALRERIAELLSAAGRSAPV
jgi:DNA-binding XRE family transcriptional regulator